MKNKNLLITGAATRVGKAIALHFAEKGWNIALHYFRSSSKDKELKKIIEHNWVKAALIKSDLKNPKQVEKIVPLAKKKLGAIDCLINNAALFEKMIFRILQPKAGTIILISTFLHQQF